MKSLLRVDRDLIAGIAAAVTAIILHLLHVVEVDVLSAIVLVLLQPTAAVLVGPHHLRAESRRFAETAHGEMVWFNVCLMMFETQDVFDLLLRSAIENPRVSSVRRSSVTNR
jgi:hypothetical protein